MFLQILITVSIHPCLISLLLWFYLLVILLYLVMFCHSHSRVYFLANAIDNLNACLMDAGKPFYHSCANDQNWSSGQHGIYAKCTYFLLVLNAFWWVVNILLPSSIIEGQTTLHILVFLHLIFCNVTGGTIKLFDRKMLRNFRKDGHNWKKKKDGKTVKEAHEHLKVRFLIFWSVICEQTRGSFIYWLFFL